MPVTVASLKKENDSLKDEIAALKQNLEELQKSTKRHDSQASNTGGEQTSNNGGEQQFLPHSFAALILLNIVMSRWPLL